MPAARNLSRCLLLGFSLSAAACSQGSTDDTKDATAFPDHRASYAANGRTLGYVTNRYSDSISVLDLDAMVELARVPVGRNPVDLDGPTHLAIDREHDLIYVLLSYPQTLDNGPHVASTGATARAGYVLALARSNLAPVGSFRVEPNPGDLLLSENGSLLSVSHYDLDRAKSSDDEAARRADLVLIDSPASIADGNPTSRRVSVCVVPYAIAYGRDNSRAYVACTGDDAMAVVDTESATVITRVPAGDLPPNKPYALVGNAKTGRLALANTVARSLVLFSMDDNPRPLSTTMLPGVPYFAAWISDSTLLVPLQSPDGAALVDAESGEVLKQIGYSLEQCENPGQVKILGDKRVLLVCEGDHYDQGAVAEIDPTTLEVRGRVSVGSYADRLAVVEP